MKFYSTSRQSPSLGFGQALVQGLAPDNGLYFPERIPQLPERFFEGLRHLSLQEIAFEVARPFVNEVLSSDELQTLLEDVLNFPIPLVEVEPGIFSLELYHGPTLAFKDVGARFMSRCLAKVSSEPVTVLVATSGDTGSAVANGFLGVPGVDVVLLYPSGKISSIQEKQLTTLGQNITALEVDGVFDDCQHMVKQAFLDVDLGKEIKLTSANSINIARWLPQSFYYFWAKAQAPEGKLSISVPSGNFGNLSAGLLASKMGLKIDHWIAATNSNHVVPDFLEGKDYLPRPSQATISNAMDVGAPSNFVRMQHLFGESDDALRAAISGYWLDDSSTKSVMKSCFENTGYVLDPHGAIAYDSLKNRPEGYHGILLETAHPAKFGDVVFDATGKAPEIPPSLQVSLNREKHAIRIGNQPSDLKDFLRGRR